MRAVIIALILMFLAVPVMAEGLMANLPDVKQGMAWDFESDDIVYTTTVDVVTYWKGKIRLGGGVSTDFDDDTMPIATLCYQIGGLDDLGFTYPLANIVNLELGTFAGRKISSDNIDDREWHVGVLLNVVKVKF